MDGEKISDSIIGNLNCNNFLKINFLGFVEVLVRYLILKFFNNKLSVSTAPSMSLSPSYTTPSKFNSNPLILVRLIFYPFLFYKYLINKYNN